MTPLDVARLITSFLQKVIAEYDETLRVVDAITEESTSKDIAVYTGFLPRANTRKDMEKMCPAVVVRPEAYVDGGQNSTVSIVIYVTTMDEDKQHGCDSLFHLMEFIRMMLLSNSPVEGKCFIAPGMKSSVPDDQPFPQWIGVLEFDVYIPQPKQYNNRILRGERIAEK